MTNPVKPNLVFYGVFEKHTKNEKDATLDYRKQI